MQQRLIRLQQNVPNQALAKCKYGDKCKYNHSLIPTKAKFEKMANDLFEADSALVTTKEHIVAKEVEVQEPNIGELG